MTTVVHGSAPETEEAQELEEDFVTLGNVDEEDTNDDKEDEEPGGRNSSAVWDASGQQDLPPWMLDYPNYQRTKRLVALHNEIVNFCKLMEPQANEMEQRGDLVKRFTRLVQDTFENAEVNVFGSQETGLYLPSSDIDIAIQLSQKDAEKSKDESEGAEGKRTKEQEQKDMDNWDAPRGSPLDRLEAALREHWIEELSYLEVIPNTRVPLVKFTHGPTNISVDVCFNQTSGVQAAKLMRCYMDALPPLRPLTFVLKYFMASRGLNQPYTGGVGSYMLQLMIISFLQHRERECRYNRRQTNFCLGGILVEFFEHYSLDFNFVTTGVSVRFDGFFFPKGATDRKKEFWQPNRPFSFALENPVENTMDVGAPSFRISIVQRSFEVALKVLLSHVTEPYQPSISILASILPPTDEMVERSRFLKARSTTSPGARRIADGNSGPTRKKPRR